MIDATHSQLKDAITKAHEALKRELGKLRTGRASAALLDSVRVDYYGTPTPISQVANVSVPEPRLITVKPWDKTQLRPLEKAIMESGLGLTPQNDGEIIRLPMPALTEDRRKELVKIAKKYGEECKVTIRHARHEAKDALTQLESDGEASADEIEQANKKVEDIVKDGTGKADEIVARKEKDILEV